MAFVELHGKATGGGSGKLDVSTRKFEAPLSMLLPNGPAWPRDDATMNLLIRALTRELGRVAVRQAKLGRELDPSTTFECLTDWEESYGLPDCAQPETLAARRAAIAAKLLAQTGHDQSLGFWQGLFETLGYTLDNVIKGFPPMTCNDDCMDQVFDSSWTFLWQLITDSGPDDALLACVVGHNAWIGTYPVIHYPWSSVTTGGIMYGLACNAYGYTAAVGAGGAVFTSDVDQEAWSVAAVLGDTMNAVCAVGGWFIAVGVGDARISKSNGEAWSPFATGTTDELFGVSRGPEDDDVAVAVGESGALVRTTDAGLSWSVIAPVAAQDLRAVTCCSGAMVAVGESGRICRSISNGATWSTVASAAMADFLGVSAWGSTVIAVGDEIWRSTDSGATWELVATAPDTLRAVTSSPSGRWSACGAGGLIMQSLDDGLTWVQQVSPTTDELYCACAYLPSSRAILAGEIFVLE